MVPTNYRTKKLTNFQKKIASQWGMKTIIGNVSVRHKLEKGKNISELNLFSGLDIIIQCKGENYISK